MITLQLETPTPLFPKWGCLTAPTPWIQVIYYLKGKVGFSSFIYSLILFLILFIFFFFVRDMILTNRLMISS